jgi:predicted RND superfamily exporter protein
VLHIVKIFKNQHFHQLTLKPVDIFPIASLFLLLGVGMDDTFVMLNAWHRQSDLSTKTISENMKDTYEEAAVSITITSITNIISFLVGAFVPGFNTVQIFCMYTAIGLVCVYVWTLTFYGGIMSMASWIEDRAQCVETRANSPKKSPKKIFIKS